MKDSKSLTVFITLFIYGILVTVWGIRLEGRVNANNLIISTNTSDIAMNNTKIEEYSDLPLQVANLKSTSDETLRLVGIIRDGLIAKGIIKPAQ